MMLLSTMTTQAQITIAGNVYGGGNAGDLGGKTEVISIRSMAVHVRPT